MLAEPSFDLIVVGEINPDLILRGDVTPAFGQVEQAVDDASLTIGSSSAIFACGAARLGLRVAFAGVVGAIHSASLCSASWPRVASIPRRWRSTRICAPA